MTSKERILAVLEGRAPDHVPLTTWCFGFPAPASLRWTTNGREVKYWYTQRLEHIHTLPQPWELADEFQRAAAWRSLGIDDLLEISVPWGCDPEVSWRDSTLAPGARGGDPRYPVLVRDYHTPSGPLRHAVRQTEPEPPGWVVQPNHVPIIEDFNIPRAVQHVVHRPADVPAVRHLFAPPDPTQREAFADRMTRMQTVADREGLCVQAWTAFGLDAAVWFMGAEGAVMMALDAPEAFGQLLDLILDTDSARTELAAAHPGVDLVCQRGWYSSTDFWSPRLFDRWMVPRIAELASVAHRHGKKFGYVMTTGVERLGPRLADAGVDLLYFVDPVQDRVPLEKARDLLADRLTLVGGTNALSLRSGDSARIRNEVRHALEVLGPTHRFILHPVDAIFPDTPWAGVETMIEAWKQFQGLD
jgi:uroporphyrinogen-III decarboxylase